MDEEIPLEPADTAEGDAPDDGDGSDEATAARIDAMLGGQAKAAESGKGKPPAASESPAGETEPAPEDETPLDTLERLAEAAGIPLDTLLGQVAVDAPQGKIPLKDVLSGFRAQPGAEYEAGLMRAARERYETDHRALQAQREPGLQQIHQLAMTLQQELGLDGARLEQLKQQALAGDADAGQRYIAEVEGYQRRLNRIGEVKALLEGENEKRRAERSRVEQEFKSDEVAALQRAMPELLNRERAVEWTKQVTGYLTDGFGFSGDEIGMITDHRHLQVIDKAMKFDRMQAAAAEGRRKRADTKPVERVRGGAPARREATDLNAERDKRLDALRKTGGEAEAAAVFEHMLERRRKA